MDAIPGVVCLEIKPLNQSLGISNFQRQRFTVYMQFLIDINAVFFNGIRTDENFCPNFFVFQAFA